MSAQVQKRPGTVVRLFANLKGQRLRLGVVAVSIVIYVALSIWNPMYSAIVIDHLWATIQACWREGAAFTFAGGLGREMAQLTVQYLFTWLFYYLQSYLMASVAESLVLSLRSQVAQKLNRLPLRFFDQNKAGEILSRVTSDLDKISEVLQTGLLKLIVAVGTIIGSLIVMFCYSLTLTGIFLVFMVIGIGITNVVARRNLACAAQRQETIAVLTGVVEEYYHGRDVIKAYNHEADSIRKVSEAAEANRAANQKADFLTNCVNPLIRMLNRLGQVVIAVISGWAMLNGTMTVGVVQAFFQYINQTAEPLTEASYMINSLQSAFASAKRTFELLDEEEEIPDPASPAVVENAVGRVAFEHVSFGYEPDRLLMHDISFEAKPGQKIAVVGATGAGKTTLINLLMRFYEVNGGRITLDGVPTAAMSRAGLRHNFGMVLQDTWLFGGTVAENIAYGRPRRRPGGDCGRRQGRQGGLLHPHHAPGLRHGAGQRCRQPLRRAAAAPDHRPGVPVRPAHHHPGRGHLQRGHPHRGGDRQGHEKADGRTHQLRHRPPPVHHPGRGFDPLHGARQHHRAGRPPDPAGQGRGLRRPLLQPV